MSCPTRHPANRGLTRRAALFAAAGAALTAYAKVAGIEIGVCEKPGELAKCEQLGYDYLEPSATTIAGMSDAAFRAFRDQVKASKIYCRSANILLSGPALKVVGTDVNPDVVAKYLDSTFDRCKALGAKVIVWGSSGSRRVPEGYSRDTAWDQIKTYLARAGEIAKAKGLVIGIEPLRRQESNIINTGAEALRLLTEVNHPNVGMIVDYYHLASEKEDPQIVRTAKDYIVHLHFANPASRRWPRIPDEDPGYAPFFEAVKDIHYEGGLSIEGTGTFDADGAAGKAFFIAELA